MKVVFISIPLVPKMVNLLINWQVGWEEKNSPIKIPLADHPNEK
jgi:hypothetical protein